MMDINYLMSILELYLNKENDFKTNLNIIKYQNSKLKINFTTNKSLNDTTSFFMYYDNLMEKNNLNLFLRKYKGDLIIIDEKYEYDKLNETCYYCIMLANSRILSFKNFSLEEINSIRNIIYDIKYRPDEIKVIINEKESNHDGYYSVLNLGETGFTGFLTLFVIVIWFLDIFVITLWIFKNFI